MNTKEETQGVNLLRGNPKEAVKKIIDSTDAVNDGNLII